jgi:hypothetical protein
MYVIEKEMEFSIVIVRFYGKNESTIRELMKNTE